MQQTKVKLKNALCVCKWNWNIISLLLYFTEYATNEFHCYNVNYTFFHKYCLLGGIKSTARTREDCCTYFQHREYWTTMLLEACQPQPQSTSLHSNWFRMTHNVADPRMNRQTKWKCVEGLGANFGKARSSLRSNQFSK